MKMFAAVAVLLIAPFAGCGNSSAPEAVTYSVYGIVRNGFQEPIAGATVRVDEMVTTTDAAGAFAIAGVVPGRHLFTAEKSEYITLRDLGIDVQNGNEDASCTLQRTWTVDVVARDALVFRSYNSYTHAFTYADQNYGSSPSLQTGHWTSQPGGVGSVSNEYWYYTFIGFDFAAIPTGCLLQHAELSLTRTGTNAVSIDLAQVLGPWDEYLITYNNMPSVQATALLPVGITVAANQTAVTVNLTNYVDSVLRGTQFRHGVFLSGDVCLFASRENQSLPHPRLTVAFLF